jgi:hypothetical protein
MRGHDCNKGSIPERLIWTQICPADLPLGLVGSRSRPKHGPISALQIVIVWGFSCWSSRRSGGC